MKKPEPIKPDRCDHEQIEREFGPLPANATVKQQADRYRMAQLVKISRLFCGDVKLDYS